MARTLIIKFELNGDLESSCSDIIGTFLLADMLVALDDAGWDGLAAMLVSDDGGPEVDKPDAPGRDAAS